MSSRNLEEVTRSEFRIFLNSFDYVLCDCDGVIWILGQGIQDVPESIRSLKLCGKIIKFVSNNNAFGLNGIYKGLTKIGIEEVDLTDIVIPSLAVIDYLKSVNFNKEIFIFGTYLMKQDFINAGFLVSDQKVTENIEEISGFLKEIQDDESIGAIIFDFDASLSYISLLKVLTYLKRNDVFFISNISEKALLVNPSTFLMGATGFISMVEEFSGRKATNYAKPSETLKDFIKKHFNIGDPKRTLFIGDSLDQDMEFATSCGFQKLLVLTGITKLEELNNCTDKNSIPDFYINSLGDLQELIKNNLNIM